MTTGEINSLHAAQPLVPSSRTKGELTSSLFVLLFSSLCIIGGGATISYSIVSMKLFANVPSWLNVIGFMFGAFTVSVGVFGYLSVYHIAYHRYTFANIYLYGLIAVIFLQFIWLTLMLSFTKHIVFSKRDENRDRQLRKWQYGIMGTILGLVLIGSCCCIRSAWHHMNVYRARRILKEQAKQDTAHRDESTIPIIKVSSP